MRAIIFMFGLTSLLHAPARVRANDKPATEHGSEHHGLESPLRALEGKSKSGARGSQDTAGAFLGRFSLGASYDNPAFAGGVGLRYQFDDALMFGFDAEWNPWVAMSPPRVREGAINAYFSVIRRFQLEADSLNIRTSAGLGMSFLLTDLVGAPAGGVGPFLGLSFLGVEWKIAPGFYLTIDPTYIAFPIPHLTGAPFGYLQYRFQFGLEFGS